MARANSDLGRASRFFTLAASCIVIAILYVGRDVLMPLAVATLITFALVPLVTRLERLHIGRRTSTILVVLLSFGLVGGLGFIIGRQFVEVVKEVPQYKEGIQNKLTQFRKSINPLKRGVGELEHVVSATPVPATQPIWNVTVTQQEAANPPVTFEEALDYAEKVLDPLATTGVVVVLVIFMLLDREDLRDRMIRLLSGGRLNLTTQAIDEAATRITRYLVAQSVVNFSYAIAVAAGLWIIGKAFGRHDSSGGFPNVLLWALLCGLLRFIPYLGIWIAMLLPVAVSFALFSGNAVFFATVGMFVTYEIVVSQFIEPAVYGSSTGLSALAVLLAAVFWTAIWGPMGLLLSTPMTVCLVVLGKHVPQLEFLGILLGDEPVLEPPQRIYQRLIALDQEEPEELMQGYAKEKSLEEIYDDILIPTLVLAERDRQREELDDQHYRFVHQSIRDMIEELGEQQQQALQTQEAAGGEAVAAAVHSAPPISHSRIHLPKGCNVNVLCLPARDVADELTGMMLAQLLSLRGYCAESVGSDILAAEAVELVEQKKIDVVCISALPPAAIAHARYLCKRLSARFSQLPTIVGLWKATTSLERARQRISRAQTTHVLTTLADAQDQLDQFSHQFAAVPAGT
jgi:predicted PurR-regulated permease PerM